MYFTGNYGIEIEMTLEQANACSHPGPCDLDVAALRLHEPIKSQLDKIDPDVLKTELSEYGAWDDAELSDHDANLTRILWIAAGEIAESN